jgi:hypothetical protein
MKFITINDLSNDCREWSPEQAKKNAKLPVYEVTDQI